MDSVKKLEHKNKELLRNMALYGIIGLFASSFDALVFYLLNSRFGIIWIYANVISVLTGITTSFVLNRKFNFRVFDNTMKRAVIFLCVGLAGLALSQFIIAFLNAMALNIMASKLISIIVVAAFQFVLNKFVSFGFHFTKE